MGGKKMVNHADDLDKASEIAQMFNDNGLKTVQQRIKPEQVQDENGDWPITECLDCGVDIPEERLNWGRVLCVECQTIKERRASGFQRYI
jgi:RNA polymerase-binding transcription factor DksA